MHVLPVGAGRAPAWDSGAALRYRVFDGVGARIEASYRASREYLRTELGNPKP